jgi:hypothetical protein
MRLFGTYFCAHPIPIHVLIQYLFLYSSTTYFWASLVPLYLTVCVRYRSYYSSCVCPLPVLDLQAWMFELIFFRWVQGFFWLKHPLFVEYHDTLHPHALCVMRMKLFP